MNDKEQYKKFLKLLPEQTMQKLLNQVESGYIENEMREVMANYCHYTNSQIKPRNKTVRKSVADFNAQFLKLQGLISTHFSLHNSRYALYPELKYSGKRDQWEKYFKEVLKLTLQIRKRYGQAVTVFQRSVYNTTERIISDIDYDKKTGLVIYKGGKAVLGNTTYQRKIFDLLLSRRDQYCTYRQIFKHLGLVYEGHRNSAKMSRLELTQWMRYLRNELEVAGIKRKHILNDRKLKAYGLIM